MIVTALIVRAIAVQIYKGNINLIHDYHRSKVTDEAGYAKAFSRAMSVSAIAMVFSGVVSLLGESAMWIAVAVLIIGLIAGIIAIVRVQKKYNGGVF